MVTMVTHFTSIGNLKLVKFDPLRQKLSTAFWHETNVHVKSKLFLLQCDISIKPPHLLRSTCVKEVAQVLRCFSGMNGWTENKSFLFLDLYKFTWCCFHRRCSEMLCVFSVPDVSFLLMTDDGGQHICTDLDLHLSNLMIVTFISLIPSF